MKTLRQLYVEHEGKASDKWSLYLDTYDQVFSAWRRQPINFLEIGIQNGGSLEIWTRYFESGQRFVGCDINPGCGSLEYQDPRVSVIVGDANTDGIESQIHDRSANFDIVIDDGSHTSPDIVRSFARYFPKVTDGGLFVIEDLHCSYWREFEGGIHHPYSSINFFKHLVDVVNHEHWGIGLGRRDLIDGVQRHYGIDISEDVLADVHSVTFANSLCFISKRPSSSNVLGPRFVAGSIEAVVPGHFELQGKTIAAPDERENPFTCPVRPPAEALADARQESSTLRRELEQLREQVAGLEARSLDAERSLDAIRNSRSWQVTSPLRAIASMFRN